MAAWYCDHGCTLYPTAYMSVPAGAASLPQEGDGSVSGTGAAPAVAVATMDLGSTTASAGASFAVHGATLTCVAAGASTTQFNAGMGAVLAMNLASAINAGTVVPTTTTGGISPYLKALVWASASGAVLTVYTRVASSDLNQTVNASATLVCGTLGNWTSAPATANFSGGMSGPFSRLFNSTALAATVNSTISTAGTYGAWIATMMGAPAAGDVVHIRTMRSGSNIVINGIGGTAFTFVTRAVGNALAYLEYRFDNGVVWSGDNGIFELLHDTAGQSPSITLGGYCYLRAQMQTGSLCTQGAQPNLKLWSSLVNTGGWGAILHIPSSLGVRHCVVEGVEVYDAGNGTIQSAGGWSIGMNGQSGLGVSDASRPSKINNSRLGVNRSGFSIIANTSSFGVCLEMNDVHMAFGGAVAYANGLSLQSNTGASINIKMVRPKFTGGGGGHHALLTLLAGNVSNNSLVIEDPIDMGQFILGDSSASICGRVLGANTQPPTTLDLGVFQAINSEREFLLDTTRRLIEWRVAGFPTTANSTLEGGEQYSLRFSVPHTGFAPGVVTPHAPQKCVKQVVVNTLGNNSLTLTQSILIDSNFGGSAYTPVSGKWWIEGAYVDTTGNTKSFSTRYSGTALTPDTQEWSSLVFSPFSGASRSYSRWRFQAVLQNVKANALVSCYLVCGDQPATMSEWCFVDPSFRLSL